ncbi:hypothetical protein C7S13_5166 [Burkholderia cepacia]|nr:hypothetical protein [Burkholderia cepacia]
MRAAHGSPAGPGPDARPGSPDRACGPRSRRSRRSRLWHEAAAAAEDGRPRHWIGNISVWGPTAGKSVPKVS